MTNTSSSSDDLGREPLNTYGSLEDSIRTMRSHRPMDLTAPHYRQQNPGSDHAEWAVQARACLRAGLHYDPGKLDLRPRTLDRRETDSYVCERIEFNTTPWFRVPGYFYTPKNVPLPAPALVVCHEWGGPMQFGADRVCGEHLTHPVILEHRGIYTSGRALSDWFATQGFCVITIDAHHFGSRIPRGIGGVPEQISPMTDPLATFYANDQRLRDLLYLGVRQLNWAGTTWMGVNYHDDSRCVDYLLSRPEVNADRIGVTGLSGGGWRTLIMAALESRIKAAVPVGWMTTSDTQQRYNVAGAIGTFCLLPGVWDHMDIPDLIAMAAPKACMVVSGTRDHLFPPKGQRDAANHIRQAYEWAGCPERYRDYAPDKDHCYDAEIQAEALSWFKRFL